MTDCFSTDAAHIRQLCGPEEIRNQCEIISHNRLLPEVLNAFPNFVLVLNRFRQIVFANNPVLKLVGQENLVDILGKTPGDVLNCLHAVNSEFGCGSTEFCSKCGSDKVFNSFQLHGRHDVEECRIIQYGSDRAFDFRVHIAPLPEERHDLFLFFLTDISHEKRRRVLERIFFHDMANIANGMVGLSRIMRKKEMAEDQKRRFHKALHHSAERLAAEIDAQRDLTAAESDELQLRLKSNSSMTMLREVAAFYNHNGLAGGCQVRIAEGSADVSLLTDHRLLNRILGNMVKNALEARPYKGLVRLGCIDLGHEVEFWVHNEGDIPKEVQLQIFKRSFSTKGAGRGLGTYSIKLLGERYLQGHVSFLSNPEDGTTFRFRCPVDFPYPDK